MQRNLSSKRHISFVCATDFEAFHLLNVYAF